MSFIPMIVHDHLITAKNAIKNHELLDHLMTSTFMMKSLHSDQTKTQTAVDSIKTTFDEVKAKHDYGLKKILRPIIERQDMIEKEQEKMSGQLKEVQNSLELFVSLILGDDAEKGEKLLPSKCTPELTMPKDDGASDGGHKGGKAPRRYKADIGFSGVVSKPTI